MKKLFTVAVCVVMLFNFSIAGKHPKGGKTKDTSSEKLSKEQLKRIKEELKNYLKNPEAYKAKVDANQAMQDSSDVQIKQLTQDLATATSKQAELENRLSECDAQVKTNEEEKREGKRADEGGADANAPANAPAKGIIYKVQLGMYKSLNINKYFDQPKLIGYEEVDGMNRYVVSYFADEETAKNFAADIRKLGIRDAFVAKYIDGTRVYEWSENPKYKGKKVPENLEDALENNGAPKKGAKMKKADD